ncbi:hypothetical protein BD310DRAFT_926846 [Dichomitus squalens]|uniref:Uncharacterized protein n=1 Tax=Dichomitus squalens TaxID=114155 RepID=A0A4Q9PVN0_9APHY|nr:hypothetical protein BD310DRAFT_926846 [Dichomitus squalens]
MTLPARSSDAAQVNSSRLSLEHQAYQASHCFCLLASYTAVVSPPDHLPPYLYTPQLYNQYSLSLHFRHLYETCQRPLHSGDDRTVGCPQPFCHGSPPPVAGPLIPIVAASDSRPL